MPFARTAPHPQAGRGQTGEDAADRGARLGGAHRLGVAAAATRGVGVAGHHRRVAAVGGIRVGVPVARRRGREAVARVRVPLLLVRLGHVPQARRHQVPLCSGEDHRLELLDPQRDEHVLRVGVPDRGRPGPAEAALRVAAEVVERLGAGSGLIAREQGDRQGLGRDGADEERRLGGVGGAGLGDDLLAVAQRGHRGRAVGGGVLGHGVLDLRVLFRVEHRIRVEHLGAGDLDRGQHAVL